MLTHGVNIVCARHEGQIRGLAVAWACQAGTDRIAISVGQHSSTREFILASKAFGLSVLTRDQLELARSFGSRSSLKVNKFASMGYRTAETGSPLLDQCATALDCRVEQVVDLGAIKIIVGRIVAVERILKDYQPLIYREDEY